MGVTNYISQRSISNSKVTGLSVGPTYRYEGVVDTLGYRLGGAFIDGQSMGTGATCNYVNAQSCDCCSNSGYPYYICDTCDFYRIATPITTYTSQSFSTNPTGGYYDAGTKKGFKSYADCGGTAGNVGTYGYPCVSCPPSAELYLLDNSLLSNMSHAGIKAADGSLWTWGVNSSGQLGNNSTAGRVSPVQLGSNSWKMIAGGFSHFAAIRSDDTLWCWGYNGFGELGDNSTTSRSSPVQVSGGGSWKFVTCGRNKTAAIKTDNTLWCWGSNSNGTLGDNSTTNRSSPVQVSGGGSWRMACLNTSVSHGIKTDGTMYGWGFNGYYAVGDNSGTNRSSPVQIGSSYSDWVDVVNVDYIKAYAVRANGTAWAWGYCAKGLTCGYNYVPTQIGSATNHASASYGVLEYEYFVPGLYNFAGFISTSGNLIGYTDNNSTVTTIYSGGSAVKLTGNIYGNLGVLHLIKNVI